MLHKLFSRVASAAIPTDGEATMLFGRAGFAAVVFLCATSAFAEETPAAGDSVYVLRFTGVMCAKAPCPVWVAVELPTCKRVTADSIDTAGVADADHSADQLSAFLQENPATVRGRTEAHPQSEAIVLTIVEILGGPDPRAEKCPEGGFE